MNRYCNIKKKMKIFFNKNKMTTPLVKANYLLKTINKYIKEYEQCLESAKLESAKLESAKNKCLRLTKVRMAAKIVNLENHIKYLYERKLDIENDIIKIDIFNANCDMKFSKVFLDVQEPLHEELINILDKNNIQYSGKGRSRYIQINNNILLHISQRWLDLSTIPKTSVEASLCDLDYNPIINEKLGYNSTKVINYPEDLMVEIRRLLFII